MKNTIDYRLITVPKMAEDIYAQYLSVFNRAWGLEESRAEILGIIGKEVFDAEYKNLGARAYELSIVQPIRNALYMRGALEKRAQYLNTFALTEPILDYGCGVGFTLAYLAQKGFTELYGYETLGPQRDLLKTYGPELGFDYWDEDPTSFGTVICLNVLEHQAQPREMLDYLYTLSDNVIANCPLDNDTETHIASSSDREECLRILSERGGNFQERYA